jgi:3-oxoadipate enol-lactonase
VPTLHTRDVRLHYEESGRGPVVVLAHGGGGDLTQWRHQVADLARDHRVIAYDARGHGQSSTAADCSIPAMVDDLGALLGHLDVRRTSLVGATLGGVTVLEFALVHPEVVEALVVVSTAPDTTDEMRARFEASAGVVESGDLAGFAEGFVSFIFSEGYVAAHAAEVADFQQRLARIDPRGYAGSIRALGNRPDLSPRLGALGAPTLVVTGALDPIPTSAPGAERLTRAIPRARAVVIPDAAHLPHIERPDVFGRCVREFLAEARAAQSHRSARA